jgi:thiol-disulfide isomerase/thioredoxin
MTPKKSAVMKGKLLITIYFMTSYFLAAQVSDFTYGSKSVSSDNKYGQLIMEMPFGAKLYRNHYIKAQELLDNIKSVCKAKAIFIDFWATWCGPCIEAMPNNKKLYFETKILPIEFIYICSDYRTSIDNWITKISILKQPGIHIFADDAIIREMWKLFPVGGGFPSYIYIDANGQFKPDAIPLNSSTTTDRLSGLIKK